MLARSAVVPRTQCTISLVAFFPVSRSLTRSLPLSLSLCKCRWLSCLPRCIGCSCRGLARREPFANASSQPPSLPPATPHTLHIETPSHGMKAGQCLSVRYIDPPCYSWTCPLRYGVGSGSEPREPGLFPMATAPYHING